MQIDGSKAELDVFTGKLAGLVLIDFEFDSLDAKASFTPPDFILADVTQEDFIAAVCWPARVMKISLPSWLDLAISACICSRHFIFFAYNSLRHRVAILIR